MIFEKGAKEAIERILEAYGFSSRQQLCQQLGISKSTLANRIFRDNFPADYVVQCALETSASLLWLSTGQGEKFPNGNAEKKSITDLVAPTVSRMKLKDGKLTELSAVVLDQMLFPSEISAPLLIEEMDNTYLIEKSIDGLKDGVWLVDVEGNYSIKKVIKIPVGKIRVSGDDISFDCNTSEINLVGRVYLTISKN